MTVAMFAVTAVLIAIIVALTSCEKKEPSVAVAERALHMILTN